MSDVSATGDVGMGDSVVPADAVVPSESTVEDEPARPKRPRRLAAKITVLVLLVIAVSAVAFASQTRTGQRIVVNEVLARVRAELAGELVVGEVRSPTLFAGLTLVDVRLDAAGGQRVLTADSMVVRYSLISMLVGSPRLGSSTFYGLDLEITRQPGEDQLNVERILAADTSAGGSGSGAPADLIDLGRISVRGGRIVALVPADEPSRTTVEGPDGRPLRRLAFEGVDLDLEETVVRPSGPLSLDARLAYFSSSIRIVDDPVVVRAAVGELTFGDDGIRVANASFRLPSTLLEGDLAFGPSARGEPWRFSADLQADDWSDLADLAWIDRRVPDGEFRGAASVRTDAGLSLALYDLQIRAGASDVVLTGGVRFDDGISVGDLAVSGSPLAVADLDPWVERELPIDGFLSGQATLSGTAQDLRMDGRVTVVPNGAFQTTADFSGTIHAGANPGADSLVVQLDPLDYRVVEGLWPQASVLGTGSGSLTIDGRANDGLVVVADLTHVFDADTSRVSGRGTLTRDESGMWSTEAEAELAPLSADLIQRFRPVEGLRGSVAGPVRLQGTLADMRFSGELTAGGGQVVLNGSMDLDSIGAAYTLDLDAEAVDLTAFTDRVVAPATVSGRATIAGSGLTLDSVDAVATLAVRPSRIGPVRLDAATAEVRAANGVLTIDTVEVDVSGARLAGAGSLGMTETTTGSATFAFAADSLQRLRPMFMGDSILVRDGLSPLEMDLLRVRGIEPDTLPTELDVRMTGSARGTAELRGHLRDLAVDLSFEGHGLAYRSNEIDSAWVTVAASGLPDITGDWTGNVRARGITWEGRTFDQVEFDGVMASRRGEGALTVRPGPGERYFATGVFALDSTGGGEVALAEGSFELDDLAWVLAGPSRITWDSTSVRVDSLELQRVGQDPARLTANGTLTRGGNSSFRLDMEGFHVEDATRILQRSNLDVSGHVDLSLTVLGPAESPVLNALFSVEDPQYGALALSRLSGSVEYSSRVSAFRIDAWDEERSVLSAFGTLPYDLALTSVERRSLDQPMDVRVTANVLDADIPLAYFGTLEDVAGTIDADLRIGGTSQEPEPVGTIRLVNGAWTIAALGVRHSGLEGELDVRPDRTVGVRLETASAGRSSVTGTVSLASLANPDLDLVVTLDRFQAVDRRDIESMLSGSFTVQGPYQLPVAEGQLRVDQGTLFVDEFARAAGVVDLRDPTLFADGFAVDTTVFITQPILASLRNPFLDNLSVDIDLSVPRDLWIRSNEMNVEIGGELLVRYDRRQGDLVMVGDLQALRGSYLVLGRTFEVDGGTVSFLGQPGVNPALNIQALSRVRRRQGERLEIRAAVTGTLVQPLVTLSTTEAGLTQSDLVSYLLFGVPSGELGVSTAAAGQGDMGTALGQNAVSFGSTYATGFALNQVGAALAQGIGIDYLAVSQRDLAVDERADFLNAAQFEVGTYLGEDLFLLLVLSAPGEAAQNQRVAVLKPLRGVRVEYAFSDEWFLEGFLEDRFLRSTGMLAQTGLEGEKVVGVLLVRDWGYGRSQP